MRQKEIVEKADKRRREAVALRKEGKTLREIGIALGGVSGTMAAFILNRAKEKGIK
jgi:hypothetical protein